MLFFHLFIFYFSYSNLGTYLARVKNSCATRETGLRADAVVAYLEENVDVGNQLKVF